MTTNKITIIGSIIAIMLIISIPTIYKVYKKHNDNLYKVVDDKIINASKKCYYEGVCEEEKTTLEELIDKKYLELPVDPVTKEVYNKDSYVIKEEKDNQISFKFVRVE